MSEQISYKQFFKNYLILIGVMLVVFTLLIYLSIVSKKSCVPCNRRKCKFLKKTKNIYAPCMEEIETDTILCALDNI